MRKILIAVMAMVTMFWFATSTHATLWDRGGGLIYDDVLIITWLQNTNYAGGRMNWADADAWAENLNYYDPVRDVTWSDWRLPSAYNQDGTGPDTGYVDTSEIGHMYYNNLGGTVGGPFPGPDFTDGNSNPVSFENLQPDFYWSDTEYSAYPGYAWFFYFYYGTQSYSSKDQDFYYAWAVRPGDVAAVPEPATMLFLGSGLLGLLGLKRKFRK